MHIPTVFIIHICQHWVWLSSCPRYWSTHPSPLHPVHPFCRSSCAIHVHLMLHQVAVEIGQGDPLDFLAVPLSHEGRNMEKLWETDRICGNGNGWICGQTDPNSEKLIQTDGFVVGRIRLHQQLRLRWSYRSAFVFKEFQRDINGRRRWKKDLGVILGALWNLNPGSAYPRSKGPSKGPSVDPVDPDIGHLWLSPTRLLHWSSTARTRTLWCSKPPHDDLLNVRLGNALTGRWTILKTRNQGSRLEAANAQALTVVSCACPGNASARGHGVPTCSNMFQPLSLQLAPRLMYSKSNFNLTARSNTPCHTMSHLHFLAIRRHCHTQNQ